VARYSDYSHPDRPGAAARTGDVMWRSEGDVRPGGPRQTALAKPCEIPHYPPRKRKLAMQRARAIAIAAAEQQARQSRLIVAASLLLLPAALLLLLISP
jgi:hypothetical protein